MEYKITPIAYSVHSSKENPIYSETATHVKMEDEGGGPFVVLTQDGSEEKEIRVDVEELEKILETSRMLIGEGKMASLKILSLVKCKHCGGTYPPKPLIRGNGELYGYDDGPIVHTYWSLCPFRGPSHTWCPGGGI